MSLRPKRSASATTQSQRDSLSDGPIHPSTVTSTVHEAIKSIRALYKSPRSAIPCGIDNKESIKKKERWWRCNIKDHYSLNLFGRERLMMLSLRFMGPSIYSAEIYYLLQRWLNRQSPPLNPMCKNNFSLSTLLGTSVSTATFVVNNNHLTPWRSLLLQKVIVPYLVKNKNVQYRVQKSPRPVSILSHINPVQSSYVIIEYTF
jgi:hypothetical protein